MDKLTFEGKEYVSSKRASGITGYAKDYIGQLCRLGKLDARMVGRNWYIALSSLEEHKKAYKKELETLQRKETGSEVKTTQEEVVSSSVVLPESESKIGTFKTERYPRRMVEETVPLRYETDERPLIPHLGSKKEDVNAVQVKSRSTPERATSSVQRTHKVNSFGPAPIVGSGEIIPDPFEIAQVEREMAIQQPISYKRESADKIQRSWDNTDEDVSHQNIHKKPHIAKLGFVVAVLLAVVLYSSIFVVEQRVYERTTENDYALVSSKLLTSYFK